jgi:hypothetical protein
MAIQSVEQSPGYTFEQLQEVDRAAERRVQRQMRQTRSKVAARRGELQSVFRSDGEWIAVVVALNTEHGAPVLSHLVPVRDLQGNAKRKAERWMKELA